MSAGTQYPTHGTAQRRLSWWALLIPGAVFAVLLALTVFPGPASAAASGPAPGAGVSLSGIVGAVAHALRAIAP
ncbi:hypothetical protein ACFP1Z_19935 [Streptomyces gamaensis]|uniref:Uncharacterized protein n=1 Tax=Streptomyces gamaensis TaxID=1763542 RepID=A0ABW0Z158_9ACTN